MLHNNAIEKPKVIHIGSRNVNSRELDSIDVKATTKSILQIGKRCTSCGVNNFLLLSIIIEGNIQTGLSFQRMRF